MSNDSKNLVSPGVFVISKAGRDKLRPFIVLEVLDSDFVLIADGDLRKVDKPKRKKIKHLNISKIKAENIAEKLEANVRLTDVQLRKAISDFSFGQRA